MNSKLVRAFAGLFMLVICSWGWAGPVEEVTAFAADRNKAFEQGNLDAYTDAFADTVILTPSFQAYRVEGKPAVKQFFADMFQAFPKRRFSGRGANNRAYNDNLVTGDYYGILSLTNEQGKTHRYQVRGSNVWAKLNGKWQLVEQHISRIPTPE